MNQKSYIIAHRGGMKYWPENTLPAFAGAMASQREGNGADGIECDLRISADGQLVLHHDAQISEPPHKLIYQEKAATLGLPLFTELCALMRAQAPPHFKLYVELKSTRQPDERSALMAAFLRDITLYENLYEHLYLVSFDWRLINIIRARKPDIRHYYTSAPFADTGLNGADIIAKISKYKGQGWFAYHEDLTPALINMAHEQGLRIGAWTINDPARIKHLANAGVEALITDDPYIARE